MSDADETPIVFKKRKQRANIRSKPSEEEPRGEVDNQKQVEDEEEDDSVNRSVIDEFRELKRMKLLSGKGINVMDLLNDPTHKRPTNSDGKGDSAISKLESELDLGQVFSAETNKRDEDGEMNKYIDKVMEERAQKDQKATTNTSTSTSSSSKAPILDQTHDMFLKIIPEELLALARKDKQEKEEMLSSQMLTSIPEVDLGVEEKIKNIEKTEAARIKYFTKRARERAEQSTDLMAPQNLSSCYKKEPNVRFDNNYIARHSDSDTRQNNGFDNNRNNRQQKPPAPAPVQYDFEPVVQIGDAPATLAVPRIERNKLPGKNTASDDFVFERFKKNMHKK